MMNWPEVVGLVSVTFILFTFLSILVIKSSNE